MGVGQHIRREGFLDGALLRALDMPRAASTARLG
jgi:hypothetical protein